MRRDSKVKNEKCDINKYDSAVPTTGLVEVDVMVAVAADATVSNANVLLL